MFSLPSSRPYLLPALGLLAFVLFFKAIKDSNSSSTHTLLTKILQSSVQRGIEIPIEDIQKAYLTLRNGSRTTELPPKEKYYYSYTAPHIESQNNPYLALPLTCALKPSPHTNHIRLPNIVRNITHSTPDTPNPNPAQQLFNPTVLALPPWSPHHYLLVSRVVTEGLHQESLICFADLCHDPNSNQPYSAESKPCSEALLRNLGPAGGLHCATPPVILDIPPTPALKCEGAWAAFPAIPGFHDPRIFWSGRGEPLILVNSASQYACVGLWMMDLRVLVPELGKILDGGKSGAIGPPIAYTHLTELTRNPASDRGAVEKNWLLFFGVDEPGYVINQGADETLVHYDLFANIPRNSHNGSQPVGRVAGRSFAKLIGNGFTTPNLSDPFEPPCPVDDLDAHGRSGHWHQASNALKLILCTRGEARKGRCNEGQEGRVVNFAVVHRKFNNEWELPLRYERYFVTWDARKPFRVLGLSRFPVLFWNETASGWGGMENWVSEVGVEKAYGEGWNASIGVRREITMGNDTRLVREGMQGNLGKMWAYFTYTPSIAWAWRPMGANGIRREDGGSDGGKDEYLRRMHVGYLDDKVLVGIGLDDIEQAFVQVKAETLLQCLRACPESEDGDHDHDAEHGDSGAHTERP